LWIADFEELLVRPDTYPNNPQSAIRNPQLLLTPP